MGSDDDFNLVPIDEEEEENLEENDEQSKVEEPTEITFSRGGFGRSTIRNSKKKNFKDLRINMDVVKNNHAFDSKYGKDINKKKESAKSIELQENITEKVHVRDSKESITDSEKKESEQLTNKIENYPEAS